MKSFELTSFPLSDPVKFIKIGSNITEPKWTIRPKLIDNILIQSELSWLEKYNLIPSYTAVIMTPANSICKTHVDDKAKGTNLNQRKTAINVPIQGWDNSSFQYMDEEDVIETIQTKNVMCWDVSLPHRIDNSKNDLDRITLSFGFVESVGNVYRKLF